MKPATTLSTSVLNFETASAPISSVSLYCSFRAPAPAAKPLASRRYAALIRRSMVSSWIPIVDGSMSVPSPDVLEA